jgi:hypothetical protein
MSNKNTERYDLRIEEEAPLNKMLSKAFLPPIQTPEAELARLIDKGVNFDYRKTLFYRIRSGEVPAFKEFAEYAPTSTVWWNMPWLNEPLISKKRRKKHHRMLRLLKSFTSLFRSIKKHGVIINTFDTRIRVDKLKRNNEVCYIYVDANKRMGILGYLINSGQLELDSIPVKIARQSSEPVCDWMSDKKAKMLFNHPFEILKRIAK